MKKAGFWVVLCCAAALIGSCAVPTGDLYMSTKGAEDTEGSLYVLDYNLQTYVPIPVKDSRPVFLVDSREDLTGEVIWKDDAGTVLPALETFQPNTVYQADIRLTPKPGYAFNPDSAFAYHPGKIKTQSEEKGDPTRVVRVTYNNSDDAEFTFVTDYNLESYIPIPMSGEHPVRVVNTRAEMTIVVGWNETGFDNPISDSENFIFVEGVVYQAVITLTVKPGYRFAEDKNFAYPDGMVTTQPGSNSDREVRTLSSVEYKPAKEPVAVRDFDLTPYIPKPVSIMTPVWSFSGSQYSGTIIWKNNETQAVLIGPFQYNTSYTAELTLTPASGYTLKNIGQNGFIHSGALSCTNPAGGAFVTLNFSETGSAGSPTMVYDTILTNRLPKPVHGASPVAAFGGPQYTGAVSWKDANNQHFAGTFQTGMSYTAVVILTPKAGYTFLGIKQNVFTHAAALPGGVTNAAGSGTITINFSPVDSLSYYVDTFGPVTNEKSALWLMKEKRDSRDPVTIEIIPPDNAPVTEPVEAEKAILAGHFTSPTHITINGHGRTLKLQTKGTLITVGDGVTLTLLNITLQGIDDTHSLGTNNSPLAIVQRGGKLILGEGAVLTRNRTTVNIGGVQVTDEGELIMHQGAQIKKMSVAPIEYDDMFHGGGVFIERNGKFTMTGGIIGGESPEDKNIMESEHSVESGGGVLVKRGVFTMTGGKIRNNVVEASYSAGGVRVLQGGVFNMSGGEISKNRAENYDSAGGVAAGGGTEAAVPDPQFTMSGNALIADNLVRGSDSGGGVNFYNFTMNGGTIRNNVAEGERSGGGVNGSINMNGGTITGNRALGTANPDGYSIISSGGSGGGVNGSINMNGGTIVGNEATDDYSGGGVYGSITMYGGTIGANNAGGDNSANNVFVIYYGLFSMFGGTINAAAGTNQCGVYLSFYNESSKATFTMSGSAKVDPNNHVFLKTGTVLTIGGNLTTEGVVVNIICENPNSTTYLLETSNPAFISSSYLNKIRYDNGTEHIDPDYYQDGSKYYIKYQELASW